jgi:hypothetical protein
MTTEAERGVGFSFNGVVYAGEVPPFTQPFGQTVTLPINFDVKLADGNEFEVLWTIDQGNSSTGGLSAGTDFSNRIFG